MTPEHFEKMEARRKEWRARVSQEAPPPHPPGTDRRPLDGFSAIYAIDFDQVVWTCRGTAGIPCDWRPIKPAMRGRNGTTPCVRLRLADGRVNFYSVAKLHRRAFTKPVLPARAIFPEWYDDQGDADADRETVRVRGPAPRSRAPITPAPPASRTTGKPGPMWRDDLDDEWLPPIVEPPSGPAEPPAPAPDHPGGPLRFGPEPRGTDNGRSKLTEADVAELKGRRREGWSTGELARFFGVTRGNVCAIIHGKTWRGVEPSSEGGEPC